MLAVSVAAILILIDYKLKRDLVQLFARIESAIETGNRIYGTGTTDTASDPDIRDGFVVGNNPTMETTNVPGKDATGSQNGHPRSRNTTANRNGGTRNTKVPSTDKPMGS